MIPCVVCVPARNEAATLPALIAALDGQAGVDALRVLVLANNCDDGTACVARAAARRVTLRVMAVSLPPDRANAGVARGMAMEAGMRWLRSTGAAEGVLISTDADATPPPHWVAATLAGFEAGAEVVGGEIRLPDAPLPAWLRDARAQVARYWRAVRALAERVDPLAHDPPPRHGDHTGASLAVTMAAYEAAGGVPPIVTGEDAALVAAVERQGGRVRHAPDVWTSVSVREDGRATGGMAAEMRRWRRLAETGAVHSVPGAAFWQAHFRRRRELREAYGRDPALARRHVNDIAYVARMEAELPALPPEMQEIGAATAALEALAR